MSRSLASLADYLKGRLIGNGSLPIQGVNSLDAAKEGEITFADDPRRLSQALATRASAVIVGPSVKELDGRAGISVQNPKLAFALLLDLFYPQAKATGVVHSSAVVSKSAQIGPRVDIGANAYVAGQARIGGGATLMPGVYVGEEVTIGQDSWIGPNVAIYRQCRIGSRVRIHAGSVIGGDGFGYVFHEGRHVKVPQVGNVIIEDDVELGCNVCVDRATLGSTVVGKGTKVDNLVQIAHNDQIGPHVILCGQVGLSGTVKIGSYSVLAGKAGVVDHVTIGEGANLGAASVVIKDVPAGETAWGYPARAIGETKERLAAVGRLPAMRKKLLELESRIKSLERAGSGIK